MLRVLSRLLSCAVVLAAISSACGGGGSRPPTTPPPTPPTTPPTTPVAGTTSGRIVNGLDQNQGIGGATVQGDGLGSVTADAQGRFTLQSPTATEPVSIRVSSPSIHERRVFFKVPGEAVTISTFPASIQLSYVDEMCRNTFGGLTRWTTAPVLIVERSAIEYPSRVSTGELVPDEVIERTIGELRQSLNAISAGRFPDFAAVQMRETPAGSASILPDGVIGLTWQTRLLERWTHVAYGARAYGGPGAGLIRGEVALDRDWHVHGLPAGSRRDFFFVVQHELGHAMGFSHTKFQPSFMYEVFLMTISAVDRQVFEIVMQRPNGNSSPDADPSGVSLNLTTGSREMVVERCGFLRR